MLGNDLANISDMNREKERGDSVAGLAGKNSSCVWRASGARQHSEEVSGFANYQYNVIF